MIWVPKILAPSDVTRNRTTFLVELVSQKHRRIFQDQIVSPRASSLGDEPLSGLHLVQASKQIQSILVDLAQNYF